MRVGLKKCTLDYSRPIMTSCLFLLFVLFQNSLNCYISHFFIFCQLPKITLKCIFYLLIFYGILFVFYRTICFTYNHPFNSTQMCLVNDNSDMIAVTMCAVNTACREQCVPCVILYDDGDHISVQLPKVYLMLVTSACATLLIES